MFELGASGGLEATYETELDEQWAYVFGKRKDEAPKELKALLAPFFITRSHG